MKHAVGFHVNILLFFTSIQGLCLVWQQGLCQPGLGLVRRPEAGLDGVGISSRSSPSLPIGPPDHSPKLPGFSMGNPVSGFYDWLGHLSWMSSGWLSWYVLLP